ncbi:hypothetical protein evm_013565 [Chilo suppressalis]|nr:hypothetical protein evm_013565 [Chilo suppressalis]
MVIPRLHAARVRREVGMTSIVFTYSSCHCYCYCHCHSRCPALPKSAAARLSSRHALGGERPENWRVPLEVYQVNGISPRGEPPRRLEPLDHSNLRGRKSTILDELDADLHLLNIKIQRIVARFHFRFRLTKILFVSGKKRYTTAVVLVTRQMALGTATEIDKLPKLDFRARSRVVFGHNCSAASIPVRDYSYHPDYETSSYSALAIIQLETDYMTEDCKKPLVKLYEMIYVNSDECKSYYRKSGLDISSMWPTHVTCAKAVSGGECVWRSGAVLVLRQAGQWKLVGVYEGLMARDFRSSEVVGPGLRFSSINIFSLGRPQLVILD